MDIFLQQCHMFLHPLPYMCAGNMHKGQGCEQCTNKTSQQQAIELIRPSGNSLSMHL